MPGVATLDAAPGQSSLSLFGRNWVHRPALTLAREQEALVALLGDLIALPAVPADAFRAEVGQEAARLPGDVGSHVPGIDARHQARVHDLGDMGAPRVLRLRDRLDRCKLGSSHVGDAFGDPLDDTRVFDSTEGLCGPVLPNWMSGLRVEALGAVLEVAQDLVLLRIALGPVPFLQQVLVERVTVDVAVRVAARAGIAIPVPPTPSPASNTMTFRSSLSRSECIMYIPENPAPMMTASKSKKVTWPPSAAARILFAAITS